MRTFGLYLEVWTLHHINYIFTSQHGVGGPARPEDFITFHYLSLQHNDGEVMGCSPVITLSLSLISSEERPPVPGWSKQFQIHLAGRLPLIQVLSR